VQHVVPAGQKLHDLPLGNRNTHCRRQLWGTGALHPFNLQQFTVFIVLWPTKFDSDYMLTVASCKHPVTFVPLLAPNPSNATGNTGICVACILPIKSMEHFRLYWQRARSRTTKLGMVTQEVHTILAPGKRFCIGHIISPVGCAERGKIPKLWNPSGESNLLILPNQC